MFPFIPFEAFLILCDIPFIWKRNLGLLVNEAEDRPVASHTVYLPTVYRVGKKMVREGLILTTAHISC